MKSLPLGSRIVDDRIVIIEEEIEADRLIPSDLRSARLVQSVANTISPFIKVTIDCPSQHPAEQGFMPIFDVQAKMVNDRVIYKFYKKKVSKQTVIHASSALPANTKRHALVSEGLRRLRLTDRSLPWSEIESIMTVFSNTLRCSGFSAFSGARSLRLLSKASGVSARLQIQARARLCSGLGATRVRRDGTRRSWARIPGTALTTM